jgi:hypothetical protein
MQELAAAEDAAREEMERVRHEVDRMTKAKAALDESKSAWQLIEDANRAKLEGRIAELEGELADASERARAGEEALRHAEQRAEAAEERARTEAMAAAAAERETAEQRAREAAESASATQQALEREVARLSRAIEVSIAAANDDASNLDEALRAAQQQVHQHAENEAALRFQADTLRRELAEATARADALADEALPTSPGVTRFFSASSDTADTATSPIAAASRDELERVRVAAADRERVLSDELAKLRLAVESAEEEKAILQSHLDELDIDLKVRGKEPRRA